MNRLFPPDRYTHPQWYKRRDQILQRDDFTCQKCRRKSIKLEPSGGLGWLPRWIAVEKNVMWITDPETSENIFEFDKDEYLVDSPFDAIRMEVHHKYYMSGRQLWEYCDCALITLCADCHSEVHRVEHIPTYSRGHNAPCACAFANRSH